MVAVLLLLTGLKAPSCDLYTRMEAGSGWTQADTRAEERAKQQCLAQGMCLDLFDKQGDNDYRIRCRAPLPKEQ
jgi:hypothetical protein